MIYLEGNCKDNTEANSKPSILFNIFMVILIHALGALGYFITYDLIKNDLKMAFFIIIYYIISSFILLKDLKNAKLNVISVFSIILIFLIALGADPFDSYPLGSFHISGLIYGISNCTFVSVLGNFHVFLLKHNIDENIFAFITMPIPSVLMFIGLYLKIYLRKLNFIK